MSRDNSHDPRDRLVREKYFSLHPKPLERWLWQQGLPQAAERVFWLHWEEGMRSGDWCSQVPLKRVASLCCVDPSTVTRAYQVLKARGLIRRQDPGRDVENPFQQAMAVTEVRIPRELLVELSRSPNRPQAGRKEGPQSARPGAGAAVPQTGTNGVPREPVAGPSDVPSSASGGTHKAPLSREQIHAMWGRVSGAELSRFFTASRNGITTLEFDADTRLTAEDRGEILRELEQMARARREPPKPTLGPAVRPSSAPYAGPRRLSALELARTRKRVQECVSSRDGGEVLRQLVWAVEEGALRRFEAPLAVNIALKKIREGAWTRPNRMPPNWARLTALPETCSAA